MFENISRAFWNPVSTQRVAIFYKKEIEKPTKSETESDAESIISDEEEERNSILMTSSQKKSKPWNESTVREKYGKHNRKGVFPTEPRSGKCFSFKTEIHKPAAYSILLIGANKDAVFRKLYCALDALSNLILCLQNISKALLKYMKRNIPMDKDGIVAEDKCHLCKQEFPKGV
ncbi:hypothetical protein CDAR_171941 [Caerostris darwini]|uniref:Uncharacterized protein n=1 Tax=Caerostris darwini TaxID=1538125 RepID=A0AAV4UI20_9ARAC|nr:hypothetical protein CDAR_171941 [Caerostris darwini]